MDKKKTRKAKYEMISVDDIVMMSDDDLRANLERVRDEIDNSRSSDMTMMLEQDFCYLQREYQIRDLRSRAHYEYQQRCIEEDRAEYLREQQLPEYKPEPPPRRW